MAFTSTPAEATDKVKRIPIIVGETIASNVDDAGAYQGQRYLNCYPKRVTLSNTDDKWVLTKTPAWIYETRTFSGSGTDPITCVSSDGAYLWKGKRLYSTAATPVLEYTPADTYVVKSMFLVINAASTDTIYAGILYNSSTGNVHSYTWNASTTTFTLSSAISNTVVTSNPFQPNISAFLNGKLFVLGTGGRIFNSSAGAYTTWNSTSYVVPEMSGDATIAILTYKNHLVAFGSQGVEFFYDAAIEIGSPLQRQEAYYQKYGIRDTWNVVVNGDLVYFLSWEDRAGWGVYTLDNYEVKRISSLYIDTLLSNADTTGGVPHQVQMCIADMYGDLCLVFFRTFAPLFTGGMAYSSKHRVWFEITFPDATPALKFCMFQWAQTAILSEWLTYFIGNNAYVTDTVYFYYLSKDYDVATPVTAEFVEDITDLGTQNWKHYKSIYFVGDPGDNIISLSWTPYMNYSNWSSYYARNASGNLDEFVRWDNLGRYRRLARRWKFYGNSNILMEGSEIKYSLGSN